MQTPLIEGASESLRRRLQDLVGLQPIPRIGRPVGASLIIMAAGLTAAGLGVGTGG